MASNIHARQADANEIQTVRDSDAVRASRRL
jgi:hypothetical protein